ISKRACWLRPSSSPSTLTAPVGASPSFLRSTRTSRISAEISVAPETSSRGPAAAAREAGSSPSASSRAPRAGLLRDRDKIDAGVREGVVDLLTLFPVGGVDGDRRRLGRVLLQRRELADALGLHVHLVRARAVRLILVVDGLDVVFDRL